MNMQSACSAALFFPKLSNIFLLSEACPRGIRSFPCPSTPLAWSHQMAGCCTDFQMSCSLWFRLLEDSMSNSMATTYWLDLLLQTELRTVRLLCPLHLPARRTSKGTNQSSEWLVVGPYLCWLAVPDVVEWSGMYRRNAVCQVWWVGVFHWWWVGFERVVAGRFSKVRTDEHFVLEKHKLFFCRLSGRLCDDFFQKLLLVLSLVASQ